MNFVVHKEVLHGQCVGCQTGWSKHWELSSCFGKSSGQETRPDGIKAPDSSRFSQDAPALETLDQIASTVLLSSGQFRLGGLVMSGYIGVTSAGWKAHGGGKTQRLTPLRVCRCDAVSHSGSAVPREGCSSRRQSWGSARAETSALAGPVRCEWGYDICSLQTRRNPQQTATRTLTGCSTGLQGCWMQERRCSNRSRRRERGRRLGRYLSCAYPQ